MHVLKVAISWLGILHIYNIWNPVIRIAIYLVVRKFYFMDFLAVKVNGSDVKPVTQIPGLTSLPLTLTAKKSTKITFSNDKIYCNSYHRVPNINM